MIDQFKTAIKKTVEKRPLCCSCALFLLLSALLLFAPTTFKIIVLAAGLVLGIAFLLSRKRLPKIKFLLSCLSVMCFLAVLTCAVSLFAYDLWDKQVRSLAIRNEDVQVTGYPIKTVYETDFSSCCILKVQRLNGKKVSNVKVLATFPADETPELFEMIKAEGSLSLPENTDPSFDSVSYYRSKGIFATLHPDNTEFTGRKARTLARPVSEMTFFIKSHIDRVAQEQSAPLIKAFLLGDKSDLSKEVKRDFKTLGLSHLLAVSGLHLTILFALWSFFLIKLRIPMKARCGLLIPLILFFCALCGFSPSVIRASVMLILYLVSRMVDEDKDGITSLLFSGALIVFLSPYAILDVGFLLSFFSTLGIIATASLHLHKKRKERRLNSFAKSIANTLLVSLSAQIATLPIICLTFGSFSPLSAVTTLIFAPLVSLILYLAPPALLLFFVPGLSDLLFFLLEMVSGGVIRLSSLASYLKDFTVDVTHPLTPIFLCLFFLAILYLFFAKRKAPAMAATICCYLLFSLSCILYPHLQGAQIVAEANGKNDVFVLYDGGKSLIVDLSDGSKGHLEQSIHLLRTNTGDLTPDALLLTHYHKRHITSFSALSSEYYPERLYLCAPITEEEQAVFESLREIAREYKVKVTIVGSQDLVRLGRYTLSSFERRYISRSTHPVLSFTLDEGCHRFCYLSASALDGDILPNEQLVYLGVHGPIVKKPLPFGFTDRFAVLFASEELAESYGYTKERARSPQTKHCFWEGQSDVLPDKKEE